MAESRLDELWNLVKSIPAGSVASYGALGRALERPVSGLLIGRWMASSPEDIPWWRVVASDGRLPVWKRDPNLETIQRDRLVEEGIQFQDGKVVQTCFAWHL